MKRVSSLIVTSLMIGAGTLVGCQSSPHTARADMNRAPMNMTAPAQTMDASIDATIVSPTPAPRNDDRLHILLADYVVSPAALPQTSQAEQVALGAGDALGKQMFQRYVVVVRASRISRFGHSLRELMCGTAPTPRLA